MTKSHVFFFRGMNTSGRDRAVWSVFDFGPVSRHFEREFQSRDVQLYPVLGMGIGSIESAIDRAAAFLREHPVWRDPQTPVHFLGHSTGGLVARTLAAQPGLLDRRPLSCCTIATPHKGASLALRAIEMPTSHPGSTRWLRALGYDLQQKVMFLNEITPEKVAALTRNLTWPTQIGASSVVCTLPREQWCYPLRLMYKLSAFSDLSDESDGLVEATSQPFGKVLATVPIDHLRQIGILNAGPTFKNMCQIIAQYFLDITHSTEKSTHVNI